MKRLFAVLGLALVLLATPAVAQIQYNLPINGVTPSSQFIVADDTDISVIVRYIGSNAGGGEVTVETDGNLTFTVATVAYDGFECPVSGALGGIIDVSDAACNTWGEVADIINTASSDFRIELVGVKRSDDSIDHLLAAGIATVDSLNGRPLVADTTTALQTGVLVAPPRFYNISAYLQPNGTARAWAFDETQPVIKRIEATNTYASGTSILFVVAVDKNGNEVVVYRHAAAATTNTLTVTDQIVGPPGSKLLVQLVNSAAQSAVTLNVLADFLFLRDPSTGVLR